MNNKIHPDPNNTTPTPTDPKPTPTTSATPKTTKHHPPQRPHHPAPAKGKPPLTIEQRLKAINRDGEPSTAPATPATPVAKPAPSTSRGGVARPASARHPHSPPLKKSHPHGTTPHHKPVAKKLPGSTAIAPSTGHKPLPRHPKNPLSSPQGGTPLRIIPLGGLHEIGKNLTVYECGSDMIMVDCGMGFPDADMLGIDLVIPDFTFLEQNKNKIRGIVITHGHEDHIGSIPYLLKRMNVPIYATKLAIGLIQGKLKEHGLLKQAKLHVIEAKQTIRLGCMSVEFIRVNHSIPDAVAVAVHTPAGTVIYTGDFKVDYSPIEGDIIDLPRFAELGKEGVLCLLSDSTNAERPGYTMSEKTVGQSFHTLFNQAEGKRILVASFSSNIHRIQQVVDCAAKYKRKVAVSGRSMENVTTIAAELGYLKIPDNLLIPLDQVRNYPPEEIVVVTTGSQGEPMAALSRMARSEHRQIHITKDDFIIISATPIPGNEKMVINIINDLTKLGAVVIFEKMYEVHVSGHACQEELKLILSLTKPKFFMPVHGEYKHLVAHANLAKKVGIPPENILIADIGQVIQLDSNSIKMVDTVEAGNIFVDGIGVGDVGSIVIRDRQRLAQDGLIIVVLSIERRTGLCKAGPDIVSRGFVYVGESKPLMDAAQMVLRKAMEQCAQQNVRDWTSIKGNLRDALSSFIYKSTKRSPMILPIIMEV